MEKTIVITGGSLGIGAAAARALRAMQTGGAKLVITGRSQETLKLASEINCDHYLVDYTKLSDVRSFAATLLDKYPRIDVLANNVGGVINTRQLTVDGNEKTLQVNHLAGFLLTRLLQERLESSSGLVINTSSAAHRTGNVDLTDLQSAKDYSAFRAYGTAKMMNILHAAEIVRRTNGRLRAISFHPGVVATGFAREGSSLVRFLYESFMKHLLISPEKGADTLVWAANADDLVPGAYYEKRKVAKTKKQAQDAELASELWDASDALVNRAA